MGRRKKRKEPAKRPDKINLASSILSLITSIIALIIAIIGLVKGG